MPALDLDHLVQPDRVHRSVYTDQAIFDMEMDRGADPNVVNHRLIGNATWDIPVGHGRKHGANMPGWADALFGGGTVSTIFQARTGMLVGCPEEVAFRMGYIDAAGLRAEAAKLGKTELGRVLTELADGRLA